MNEEWQERIRPLRLERRYKFGDYHELRDFLDRAAALSEREDFYPDMGFGRDYVNITIRPDEGQSALTPQRREFARRLDQLRRGPQRVD